MNMMYLRCLIVLLLCLITVSGKILGKLGDNSDILDGLDGRFVLPTSEGYIRRYLLGTGQYEGPLIKLIRDILSPFVTKSSKDVILMDVGANFGLWTVPLATFLGPKGKVFAFEVQRYVANQLSATLLLNDLYNVRLMHAAVSNVTGFMRVNDISPDAIKPNQSTNFGGFSLHDDLNPAKQSNAPVSIVQQVTLDGLFEHELERKCPLFMKIDVEMFELEVFLGATNVFTECKPLLLFEALCPRLNRSLFQVLWSLGYELAWTVLPIVDYDAQFDHGDAEGRIALHSFSQNTDELTFNAWFYALGNVLAVPRGWMIDTLLAQHPNALRRIHKGKYGIGEYNIPYCVNGVQGVDGSMSRCGVIYSKEDQRGVEVEGKQVADCELTVSEFALNFWQNIEK